MKNLSKYITAWNGLEQPEVTWNLPEQPKMAWNGLKLPGTSIKIPEQAEKLKNLHIQLQMKNV